MDEEMKKTLQEIGDAQAEYKEALKAFVKEESVKGHVEPLLKAKEAAINKALTDLEDRQAANFKALEDELSTIKQSKGWKSGQTQEESAQRKAILNDLIRKGSGMQNNQPLDLSVLKESDQALFTKAMLSGSNQDGGFVTVDEMAGEISRLEKERSPVRSLVTIQTGSSGAWKQPVQSGSFAARRVGETEARTETATGTFDEQIINAEELNAEPIITQTMIDDAMFDIVAYANSEIADEFAIKEGIEFVSGDGVKQFRGITSYADGTTFGTIQRVLSANAGAIAYEDFVDLDELLLPAFVPGASWLMNRTTRGAARKLLDGDLRPLLQPDLPNGGLPQIFGKNIVDVPDMPAIGAGGSGNLSVAFGDFRRSYLVYDRMGIRILRDPFTNKPYIILSTTKRSGGAVIKHQGIKLLETK